MYKPPNLSQPEFDPAPDDVPPTDQLLPVYPPPNISFKPVLWTLYLLSRISSKLPRHPTAYIREPLVHISRLTSLRHAEKNAVSFLMLLTDGAHTMHAIINVPMVPVLIWVGMVRNCAIIRMEEYSLHPEILIDGKPLIEIQRLVVLWQPPREHCPPWGVYNHDEERFEVNPNSRCNCVFRQEPAKEEEEEKRRKEEVPVKAEPKEGPRQGPQEKPQEVSKKRSREEEEEEGEEEGEEEEEEREEREEREDITEEEVPLAVVRSTAPLFLNLDGSIWACPPKEFRVYEDASFGAQKRKRVKR